MRWGDVPYRAPEMARIQPEQAKRAPAKKDRKRWCRGKSGVPHDVRAVLDPRRVEWVKRVRALDKPCEWVINRRTGKPGWYSCSHLVRCVNCGRVMDRVKENCPDYTPLPTVETPNLSCL